MSEWFFIIIVSIFGLVIGSFLNVVIYRFHTGKSLNDRSHCLSCGTTLKWYELFPVLSYLVLWGRCSQCQSFIPYRYALVELVTAGSFLLIFLHTSALIVLVLLCAFVSVLIIGLVYDLYHMIIPDEVSIGIAFLAVLIVGYQSLMLGTIEFFLWSLLAGILAFLFFASLWWFSDGRWLGFGDAKIAFGLGVLVGLNDVFSLLVLSFWIGAIISLTVILLAKLGLHRLWGFPGASRVKMKSEVPFAPFLVIAFYLVYFFGVDVLVVIEHLISPLWM